MPKNINKNAFFIAGIVIIVLIIILLIIIGILSSTNKKETITFNPNRNITNGTDYPEVPENETDENKIDDPEHEKKITGEITYAQTEDGGNIPVPPTFNYIGGSINGGAVIEDTDGNQFVWVPVENINSYTRQIFINNGEGVSVEDIEGLNLKDINDYNTQYDDSVNNYKGFYIARYEAGQDEETGFAISKAGVTPWTQITWQKAKNAAMDMYEENDYFQTDLINSFAWDTTCNWMRNCGINIDESTNYGNYQNSIDGLGRLSQTGSNDRWCVNNIYDMGGNVWELTTEQHGEHQISHIGRGGGYWNYGDIYPISTRAPHDDSSNLSIGFRVVLYLK